MSSQLLPIPTSVTPHTPTNHPPSPPQPCAPPLLPLMPRSLNPPPWIINRTLTTRENSSIIQESSKDRTTNIRSPRPVDPIPISEIWPPYPTARYASLGPRSRAGFIAAPVLYPNAIERAVIMRPSTESPRREEYSYRLQELERQQQE